MSDRQKKPRSEAEVELEREILKRREFTLGEAIGRLAGSGALKGASPVARAQQAEVEIQFWLRRNLADSEGALQIALLRGIKASDLLLNNEEEPLVILAAYCQRVLDSDHLLRELVREADIEWARMFEERPYLEKEASPPHPADPYTMKSVSRDLSELVKLLTKEG